MVMLLVTALASFVVLATSVAADPSSYRRSQPHSLSIGKHINPQGKYHVVQRDRKRLTQLLNKGNSSNLVERTSELPLTDEGSYYEAKIGVGNPPTYYNLVVDTGSSNTWVGANTPYVVTNTSVKTSELVSAQYGSGSFEGNLYNDSVTVAPGVVASGQPIGVAYSSSGMSPRDGILGIGPTDLTFGTVSYNENTIPTVTDTLFAQGTIKQNLVAVSFEPSTSEPVVNGELTFGATDPTKYIGEINYSPITQKTPASDYWGIDATIQYGNVEESDSTQVTLVSAGSGIVDTGTTLLYVSTSAYNQYVQAIGAVVDSNTQLLTITNDQYKSLQSLNFVIGGNTIELTPNAQIRPRSLNGDGEPIYLIVQDIGKTSSSMDFILGMTFLERFYSVFDSGNRQVGLARTSFTNATTN